MRILHTVEFYSPSKGGAQEVIKQISEHLVRLGHSVTVATSALPSRSEKTIAGVQIQEFQISGNVVQGYRGEIERYQDYLLHGNFDVMLNYAAQQWAADLVFPLLDRLPYAHILVPCGFSGLFYSAYAPYFEKMPQILSQYDRLIFHASHYRDIDFARRHGLQQLEIIPNGASQEEFGREQPSFRKAYGIPDDIPLLLTVGSHTGSKGHKATIEAFRRARTGPAVLVIIGNVLGANSCISDCRWRSRWVNLNPFNQKRILLLDPFRDEVIAAYQAADLFVFASKIEYSPLVLFEAMASRTPFISTACGNAEEIVEWGGSGRIVETRPLPYGRVDVEPGKLAAGIEDLLANTAELEQMADAGYRAWQDRFTWEKITREYERLYHQASR